MAAHRHHKSHGAPPKDSSPMNCDHDMGGMNGMAACSISCCQDPSQPALFPGAFLLPAPAFVPAAGEVWQPVQIANSLELSRFAQPLSPPPRFVATIL
ncbi:MAG: hypothetical protein ACRD2O_15120 [Terriglobia bacterium]